MWLWKKERVKERRFQSYITIAASTPASEIANFITEADKNKFEFITLLVQDKNLVLVVAWKESQRQNFKQFLDRLNKITFYKKRLTWPERTPGIH